MRNQADPAQVQTVHAALTAAAASVSRATGVFAFAFAFADGSTVYKHLGRRSYQTASFERIDQLDDSQAARSLNAIARAMNTSCVFALVARRVCYVLADPGPMPVRPTPKQIEAAAHLLNGAARGYGPGKVALAAELRRLRDPAEFFDVITRIADGDRDLADVRSTLAGDLDEEP